MKKNDELATAPAAGQNRSRADSPPVDADESGTLAIGLMIAIVTMVALLTLALIISIP